MAKGRHAFFAKYEFAPWRQDYIVDLQPKSDRVHCCEISPYNHRHVAQPAGVPRLRKGLPHGEPCPRGPTRGCGPRSGSFARKPGVDGCRHHKGRASPFGVNWWRASLKPDPTYPHDYRIIAGSEVKPTIVGGQAVNLWAITFLEPSDPHLSTKYASGDLDVLSTPKILDFLKSLEPAWRVDKIPFWAFGDGREAIARGLSPDNRKLLVEVIKNVHGLDAKDITGVEEVDYAGTTYRILDPIALLKAKAANVRDFDQVGPPERHDRHHLQLVARFFPLYLRRIHGGAIENPVTQNAAAGVFSRAFETLKHRSTAKTLATEGIRRSALMPPEFAESPNEKIRNTYKWQFPKLQAEI
jgi:hypothetical protein